MCSSRPREGRRRHRGEQYGSDDNDDSYEHKYDDGDEEQDGAIRHHMMAFL